MGPKGEYAFCEWDNNRNITDVVKNGKNYSKANEPRNTPKLTMLLRDSENLVQIFGHMGQH